MTITNAAGLSEQIKVKWYPPIYFEAKKSEAYVFSNGYSYSNPNGNKQQGWDAYYIKNDRKEEFKERFESLYKDEFLLLSKEEVLEKGILGYGEKHKRLDDFIGDFLAISISDSIMRLETFLAEGKPVKKSTHCGLTDDEMLVPVITIECNKK